MRTKEEVEKIKQEREEMDKKRNQTAWLGGSILDRNSPRNPNNPNAMITLPANYTLDTAPVRDASTTNSAPASFDVPVIQVNSNENTAPKHDENDNERLVTNSLLVPDRVSVEYKDDDEETEARVASTSSSAAGISMAVPVIAVSSEATSVTILLSKKRTSLG